MQFTFTKDNNKKTYETILPAAQAAEYAIDKVFTDWTPAALAGQVTMTPVTMAATTLTWEAVEGAKAYAIFADGKFVAIVDGTETSYNLTEQWLKYALPMKWEVSVKPQLPATVTASTR